MLTFEMLTKEQWQERRRREAAYKLYDIAVEADRKYHTPETAEDRKRTFENLKKVKM